MKNKKRNQIFGLFFLIAILTTTAGCSLPTGKAIQSFNSPENIFPALQDALNSRDINELRNIFHDEDYAFVLKDLYFGLGENTTVYFGFPADEELKKPLITTKDIKMTVPNKIKYFQEDGALTAVYIDTKRTKMFAGVVLQKFRKGWKITRMYDFFVFDSPMIDVGNFYLDLFLKKFNVTVVLSDELRSKGYQTTFLFNTYLLVTHIDVDYHGTTLCTFDKKDITMKMRNMKINPNDGNLYMVDELIIAGECDYSSIVSPDLEEKYFLNITMYLENGMTLKGYYYGDLRL